MPAALRNILLIALPAVAVLVVYAVVSAGESASGGRVPIPGKRTLTLEKGSTALSYEEKRDLEEGSGTPGLDNADFLEIPPDLKVTVRGPGGRPLEVRTTSFGSVVEDEAGTRKVFAKVQVPRTGRYRIAARPISSKPPSPSVTVGRDAVDELLPWGLGALGAAALGGLVALALTLLGRRRA